jgi:hypothetical protein
LESHRGGQEIGELWFTLSGRSKFSGYFISGPFRIEDDRLVESEVDALVKIGKKIYCPIEGLKYGTRAPTVITEISSAHGDKNSASSNSNEVIHGTELISQHSKKVKNYTK